MSVKIRPYRKGGWEVDIMIRLDNGRTYRERRKAPAQSKSTALRWGQAREHYLLVNGVEATKKKTDLDPDPGPVEKEVPTFDAFADRYLSGYARANREKPSSIHTKERIIRVHILPKFGKRRLDELSQEDIQLFKGELSDRANKTVNNILSVLNTMLKAAVEWRVIEALPVRVGLLRVPKREMDFFDFDELEHMLEIAKSIDPRIHLMLLLGGEAGLRAGEMRALEWTSLDFRRRLLTVERSDWRGHVTLPKHDKIRRVPMTQRLAAALKAHRHLQGPRVLYGDNGSPLIEYVQRRWLHQVLRRANLRLRAPHTLRHTFCSHLAMRGAPARAIQELAGHADLATTQRYMHLSPAALEGAIKLLERPSPIYGEAGGEHAFGDIVETLPRRR